MKVTHVIIVLSIIAGLTVWLLDAILDFFFFYKRSFLDLMIFDVPMHEIYVRTGALGIFILFGIIISKLYASRVLAEEDLRNYSENLELIVEKSTKELRESELFLQSTIQSIPDHMYVKDKDFKILFTNKSYCDLFGLSEEKILGRTVYDLYPKQMADIYTKQDREVFKTGKSILTKDVTRTYLDGSKHILQTLKTPIKNDQGNITYMVGITRDVTKSKKLENEQEKTEQMLRTTIANVPDHMYIKDAEYRFLYVNDSYCKFVGKTREQIIGTTVYDLYSKKEADLFTSQDNETVKHETILTPDLEQVDADGILHIIQANKTALKDSEGNVTHIIGVTRDNTQRKELERMKDQFIATATHELRTPLVSILGYIHLALEGKSGEISDRLKSDLQVVARNTDRLRSLTDDLLDVRRIESGKLELNKKTIDLKKIVEDCIEEIRPFIKDNQTFDVNIPQKPLIIEGDDIRISQVLMNLLSNAIKFIHEYGKVTIKVMEETDHIKVQVSDDGIGIRKEDLGKIFEPFATIEKKSHIPGTGLGLSVTKGLVEAHKGKIWVESPGEDKGSTFTFTLLKKMEYDGLF